MGFAKQIKISKKTINKIIKEHEFKNEDVYVYGEI